jgi:NAD(P)-dependent dehydrogenase (short-subunit alcohol dehydrogenase family)
VTSKAPTALVTGAGVTDLTQPGAIDGLLASPVLDGALDYLVNAAGVAWYDRDGSALDVGDDTWHAVLRVNLAGPWPSNSGPRASAPTPSARARS